MDRSPLGYFALVSYVPDPLGSFLDQLRQSLPGKEHAQSHITLLPPRPLQIPVNVASDQVTNKLANFTAFEVELTQIQHFPETNFLYLGLGEGSGTVHDVHEALNQGALTDSEQFTFQPHLTVGGPVEDAELKAAKSRAQEAWEATSLPRRFQIENVVGLWAESGSHRSDAWRRLWTYRLAKDVSDTPGVISIGQTS